MSTMSVVRFFLTVMMIINIVLIAGEKLYTGRR